MLRKTLTILSLIGLLFSVGLWGVSCHEFGLSASRAKSGKVCLIRLSGGKLTWSFGAVLRIHGRPTRDRPWAWSIRRAKGYERTYKQRVWLPALRQRPFQDGARTGLTLPLYLTTLFFSGLLMWLYSSTHRRRKRKKLGLCVKCGYDLRASKERCPECGEGISS